MAVENQKIHCVEIAEIFTPTILTKIRESNRSHQRVDFTKYFSAREILVFPQHWYSV